MATGPLEIEKSRARPLDRPTLHWAEKRRQANIERPTHSSEMRELERKLSIEERRPEKERREIRENRFFRAQSRQSSQAYQTASRDDQKLSPYSFLRSTYHDSQLVNSLFKEHSTLTFSRKSLPINTSDLLAYHRIGSLLREFKPAQFTLGFIRDLAMIYSREKATVVGQLRLKLDEQQIKLLNAALQSIISFFYKQIEKINEAARDLAIDNKLAQKRKEKILDELELEIKSLIRKLETLIVELYSASRGSPQISDSLAA